jgi:hypothetical protein
MKIFWCYFKFSILNLQLKNLAIKNVMCVVVLIFLFLFTLCAQAQQNLPIVSATNFNANTYFEPPNQQRVKMKLFGAQASPRPNGQFELKNLKLELFGTNGDSQVIVLAPQCTYAPLAGTANSAGHLQLLMNGGKFRVEGDGFFWRQNELYLSISNHVHTTIDAATEKTK